MDSGFTDSINNSKGRSWRYRGSLSMKTSWISIHKKLLEMVPDIFTSIGILGTFLGLVWGLRDFQPTDYSAMTSSVAALVEGIKVAFIPLFMVFLFHCIYLWHERRVFFHDRGTAGIP